VRGGSYNLRQTSWHTFPLLQYLSGKFISSCPSPQFTVVYRNEVVIARLQLCRGREGPPYSNNVIMLRQGKRLSPISTFFSLVSSRASRDAPHSRFRCGDPNQCIPNFLKMPLLALPQIYTRVFHLWKSIDWDSAWVRDSRPYQLSFLS